MALLLEDYLRCPKCNGIWKVCEAETTREYTSFLCKTCNRVVRIYDPCTPVGIKTPLTSPGRRKDRWALVDTIYRSVGMKAKHLNLLA